MITKSAGTKPGTTRVEFFMPLGLWATEVSLVGDFNNWNPEVHRLEHSLHNGWRIVLELPDGREYQYRYLLDRQGWCNDCNADGYAPNPYGGYNSVVRT